MTNRRCSSISSAAAANFRCFSNTDSKHTLSSRLVVVVVVVVVSTVSSAATPLGSSLPTLKLTLRLALVWSLVSLISISRWLLPFVVPLKLLLLLRAVLLLWLPSKAPK